MKNKKFLLTFLAAVMITGLSFSQPPADRGPKGPMGKEGKEMCGKGGHHGGMFADLSPEQKESMKKINQKYMAETNQMKAKIKVLKAQKDAEMIAENPDMKKIDGFIDEIADLKKEMAKKKARKTQEMRKILTPEQRAGFDAKILSGSGHHNH